MSVPAAPSFEAQAEPTRAGLLIGTVLGTWSREATPPLVLKKRTPESKPKERSQHRARASYPSS